MMVYLGDDNGLRVFLLCFQILVLSADASTERH